MAYDVPPTAKIFGIGLSKTGTTSLAAALRYLGYRTLHYQRGGRILSWDDFLWTEAAVDTPVTFRMHALAVAFPDARFICTTRPFEAWRGSCRRFFGAQRPSDVSLAPGAFYEGRAPAYNATVGRAIRRALYTRHARWRDAYEAHRCRVDRLSNRGARVLHLSVTEGDGWGKLCQFLGHEVPDVRFPHLNSTVRG